MYKFIKTEKQKNKITIALVYIFGATSQDSAQGSSFFCVYSMSVHAPKHIFVCVHMCEEIGLAGLGSP